MRRRFRNLLAALGAVLSAPSVVSAQPPRVPVWWLGTGVALGRAFNVHGDRDDIYDPAIQATRRAEFGLRVRPRLGVGIEWTRSVDIGQGACITIGGGRCLPAVEYRALAADVRYAASSRSTISAGIGGYRLPATRPATSRTVLGIDARAEQSIVSGVGTSLSLGIREALLAREAGYWISHLSAELTVRLFWRGNQSS